MSDTHYSDIVLLLHGQGTDASTTFTDNAPSPHTTHAFGGARISTSQFKWGASSLYFDGTGDYITVDGSTDFTFGTGDWTIELWVRSEASTASATQVIFNTAYPASGLITSPVLFLDSAGTGVYYQPGPNSGINANSAIATNTWTHLAVCKASGSTRLFVNGTQVGSTLADSKNYGCTTNATTVGRSSGDPSWYFNGYINDLRVTKFARYTSDFSVPTAQFDDTGAGANSITGNSAIQVTPSSVKQIQWNKSLIGNTLVQVVPYSAKVFVSRNHKITSVVNISVSPTSILAIHRVDNNVITGGAAITVTPASTMLWHTPNHFITGAVSILATPASGFNRAKLNTLTVQAGFISTTIAASTHADTPNSITAGFIATTIASQWGASISGGFIDTTFSSTATLLETMSAELTFFESTLSASANVAGNASFDFGFITSTITALGGAEAALTAPDFGFAASMTVESNRINAELGFLDTSISVTGTVDQRMSISAGFIDTYLSCVDINITAPLFSVSASVSSALSNSIAYVLNVNTAESYRWTNQTWLHIINIGGLSYGVKSDGLYLLSGATDNGTAINGKIKTKSTDHGSYRSKRLKYVYLNSDTQVTITPFYDDVQKTSHVSAFGGRKTRMAQGPSSRYIQLELSNIVKLEGMEILTEELQRRVK